MSIYGWHYTSAQGLLNIIESKSFHVTNAKFLNDPLEKDYSLFTLVETIKKYQGHKFYENINKNIVTSNFQMRDKEHYIISLSTDHDSLAMWQYYGNLGYAIKIDIEELYNNGFVKDLQVNSGLINETSHGKVIYNKDQQKDILEKMLNKVFLPSLNTIENYNDLINEFNTEFGIKRYFFKNEAYAHEKEWRCVFTLNKSDSIQANKYRTSKKGVVVPYIIIDISKDINKIVKEIKVHPLMEEDLTIHGLELFLETNKLSTVKLSKSDIPFREM